MTITNPVMTSVLREPHTQTYIYYKTDIKKYSENVAFYYRNRIVEIHRKNLMRARWPSRGETYNAVSVILRVYATAYCEPL